MAAVAAVRIGALGRQRHHLVRDDGEVEGLLVGVHHHLPHLLQASAGRDLLGRELVFGRVVEFLQPIDHRRLAEACPHGRAVVEVGLLEDAAAWRPGIDAVRELRLVFVGLHAEEERAEDEREHHPELGEARLVGLRGLERQDDRHARTDQDEGVEGADRLGEMHVVRLRPDGRTEAEHDVAAEQRREKHDLRREEKPHDQLALRERQAGLVLQRDVAVVIAVRIVVAVVVRQGERMGVHG